MLSVVYEDCNIFMVVQSAIMLSVVMLSVMMLKVVAPHFGRDWKSKCLPRVECINHQHLNPIFAEQDKTWNPFCKTSYSRNDSFKLTRVSLWKY